MRILIVGQYFYPDSFRINEIAFSLADRGHNVTVLTGLPDYTTGKVPNEYKRGRKKVEFINGVKVIRTPVIARRTGIVWRGINYCSFLISSTFRASFLNKDFDLIFCYQTSPVLMANAAVKMKKRTGKKLFLYCLDLWPESLKAWDVKEKSLLFRLMLGYSRRIYQSCDVIGISSIPFREYLTTIVKVEEGSIVYIPQHAEDIGSASISGKAKKAGECINFAFAGNIGKVQDVECIIRAASRLKDLTNFIVHIYGSGSSLNSCQTLADELDMGSRICFHGRIDRQQLLEEYKEIDVFLLTLKKQGFIGMTMPSKLQEYMSAGKPIIAAIDGAAAEVIKEANCGMVAPPSDDEQLAGLMRKLIDNPEQSVDLGYNAYKYYKENFTKEVFLERLEQIFHSIV